jgi:hypothetical protein
MEWSRSCLLLSSGDVWYNLRIHQLLCQCGLDVVLPLSIQFQVHVGPTQLSISGEHQSSRGTFFKKRKKMNACYFRNLVHLIRRSQFGDSKPPIVISICNCCNYGKIYFKIQFHYMQLN